MDHQASHRQVDHQSHRYKRRGRSHSPIFSNKRRPEAYRASYFDGWSDAAWSSRPPDSSAHRRSHRPYRDQGFFLRPPPRHHDSSVGRRMSSSSQKHHTATEGCSARESQQAPSSSLNKSHPLSEQPLSPLWSNLYEKKEEHLHDEAVSHTPDESQTCDRRRTSLLLTPEDFLSSSEEVKVESEPGEIRSVVLSPVVVDEEEEESNLGSPSKTTADDHSSATAVCSDIIYASSSPCCDVQVESSMNCQHHHDGGRSASHDPLLEGCRRVENYRRLNLISEGTYGAVYRAKDEKTNEIVALKHIKYHERVWEEGFPLTSLREIAILSELNHQNIVNVREVVVGANPNQVFMVMEYVEHELKVLLQENCPPFSTSERKLLLKQLLEAVAYMHQHWVIHRDLKTSNLLYSNKGELKVCDFGMARKFGDPIRPYTHNVITLWYRAPEILLGQESYSSAVDMWSVGCIMGELLLRHPLFDGRTETETLDKIFSLCGAPNERNWPGVSSLPYITNNRLELSRHMPTWRKTFPVPKTHITESSALSDVGLDLLSSLLSLDPLKRISADDALNHLYFSEKPLPQRSHLMPSAPDSNQMARKDRHQEVTFTDHNIANLYHDDNNRYTLGTRIDPLKYLTQMECNNTHQSG